MDITLSEDQVMIAETANRFAMATAKASPASDGFDPAIWRQMVELGFAGICVPEEFGGANLGLFELALVAEALGRSAAASPFFSTVVEAGFLLRDAGSRAQRDHWLPRIADGRAILTVALHDADGARTSLTPTTGGFLLHGTKILVRDAGAAAAIICAADNTLVLLPAASLQRRRLAAAGDEALWEVTFENCLLSADAIIGKAGGAAADIARLQRRGAALKAAELVGIGQAALDLTLEYAKTRVQFGKPIGSFQAVQHHCVDMYRDLQVCRLLAWQAAASDAGAREVAMAKAKASEAIPALTRIAHQIHGAIAYYCDYPLELFYHRAIAAASAYGNAAQHRRVLGDLLAADMTSFRGANRSDLPVHYL
jgi:alkylation response protein AidB-like acyl-CoA dehydrogenase